MIVYFVILCAFAAIGIYATGETVAKNVHVYTLETYRPGLRASHGRTRTEGYEVRITVWRRTFVAMTRGKTYAQLVDFDLGIDWILDEFDSSFNALACASLRYHLDHSVTWNEDHREEWEALIERLSERRLQVADTDEKKAVLRAKDRGKELFIPMRDDDGNVLGYRMRQSTPEEQAIFTDHRRREVAYHERIQQARKDFIDVLPFLWS